MVEKISLVPSSNGLGHLRRLVSLYPKLSEYGFEIEIVWSGNPIACKKVLQKDELKGLGVRYLRLPNGWDGPKTLSHNFNSLVGRDITDKIFEHSKFVIADTCTWPLVASRPTILMAQFTWPIYNSEHTSTYKSENSFIRSPIMTISMREFVWQELLQDYNPNLVDVMDYWSLRRIESRRLNEIWLARSHAWTPDLDSEKLVASIKSKIPVRKIAALEEEIQRCNYLPIAIIARAGLGIVTEALSAKIPLLILRDRDREIMLNETRLVDMGTASYLENFCNLQKGELTTQVSSLFQNANWPAVVDSSDIASRIIEKLQSLRE